MLQLWEFILHVVFHLIPIIFKLLHIDYSNSTSLTLLLLQILRFLIVYSGTFAVILLILKKGGTPKMDNR